MEQDQDQSSAMRAQFRQEVMNALPKKVKNQLEGERRLGIMSKDEFRQAASHFVTMYRQEQEEREQQSEEATSKLTQMQIQETKNSQKAAVQAPVVQYNQEHSNSNSPHNSHNSLPHLSRTNRVRDHRCVGNAMD